MGRKPKPAEMGAVSSPRSSGATLRQTAAAAGVSRTTSKNWVKQLSGVRPRKSRPLPALQLSIKERETISRGLACRMTLTAIAAELGRSVSTVSREVRPGLIVWPSSASRTYDRSANDPSRCLTEPSPGIGREISWSAATATAT
jgi:hypothetical protein